MTPDETLAERFRPLEPDSAQLDRTATEVMKRFQPERRPLWREWFDFFAARPLAHGAYALAAAVLLGVLSPLGALLKGLETTAQQASVATIERAPVVRSARRAPPETVHRGAALVPPSSSHGSPVSAPSNPRK